MNTPEDPLINRDMLKSLHSDVVKRLRELIVACRLTGLRREDYRQTIIELHQRGENVPALTLIYDVITRWSATYNMIARYINVQAVGTVVYLALMELTKHATGRLSRHSSTKIPTKKTSLRNTN